VLKTNFCRECAFTDFSGVDLDAYHLLCIQWEQVMRQNEIYMG